MNQPVAGRRSKGSNICGSRLRELRTSCGLTQVELARRAGYSERLIRKAEAGGSLSLATIVDLAEALSWQNKPVSPAELCCSHEALARMFVESYDEHERLMLDYCRHILAPDFVFHFAGQSRSTLSGEWLGIDGFQAWLDELFSLVTRPARRCLHVSYLTDNDQVTARYSDLLIAADQSYHTLWVNLHFTFVDDRIHRIVDQCDTSLVTRLETCCEKTAAHVPVISPPHTDLHAERWMPCHATLSESANQAAITTGLAHK